MRSDQFKFGGERRKERGERREEREGNAIVADSASLRLCVNPTLHVSFRQINKIAADAGDDFYYFFDG